jgi:hypothetical protein
MITTKQAEANRLNAQKSTGPKTAEGKANAKMNAVTHGLLSQFALMPGDDTDQFEALRTMLFEEFQPGGGYEEALVDNLTAQFWRLARLLKMESEILVYAQYSIQHRIAKSKANKAELQAIGLDCDNIFKTAAYAVTCKNLKDKAQGMKTEVESAENSLGGAFLFDVKNGDSLSKLARHETRIRNDIRKIVAELEQRQEKKPKPIIDSSGGWHSLDGTPAFPDAPEDIDDTDGEPETPV